MNTQMEKEFQQYLKDKGITRVHTLDDVDAFLAERKEKQERSPETVAAAVDTWLKANPDYLVCETNRQLMDDFLEVRGQPATVSNLDRAYAHLKREGTLLQRPEPEPEKPEKRVGAWRNGRFHPNPAYNQPASVTYAQHADVPAHVGQSDPTKVAAGEPIIRKSVNNMTADEYLKLINSSRTFQKKMDESKL